MTVTEPDIAAPAVPGVYPWQDRETRVRPGEEWRAHPVWATFEVSNLGRVYNMKTARFVGYVGHPGGRNGRNGGPYFRVDMRSVGGPFTSAHVLVLETFVGPRPFEHDGDHVNHDCLDNRLTNLRWRPSLENRADHPGPR